MSFNGFKYLALANFRRFSTSRKLNFQVTLCGAAGGVGQPLSLLLRMHPLVTKVKIYDLCKVAGVLADLSHIDTKASIDGFEGAEKLECALECANVVIIAAGKKRKPGMSRDDLFEANADTVKFIVEMAGKTCPQALITIVTNPINSLVPMAAEVLRKAGKYDPKRLFGVVTLDAVRATKFIADFEKIEPKTVQVPVIGGHQGETILPIISQMKPPFKGKAEDRKKLIARIREGGDEVIKAKAGGGSATLSTAYAIGRFTDSLLKGLKGDENIVEYAYVESDCTDAKFFSTPVLLGRDGLEKNLGLPKMDPCETEQFEKAVCDLKKAIETGTEFATKPKC